MDEIDLFGYSELSREMADRRVRFVDRYQLIEFKGMEAIVDTARQAMKYVDWIAHPQAAGDYGIVRAFVVVPRGAGLSAEVTREVERIRRRTYVEPVRPYPSREWNALAVIGYRTIPTDAVHVDVALEEELSLA